MKIRIYDDSIRLRLDRAEVDAIGAGEVVECATRFTQGNQFTYRLSAQGEQTVASFKDGCIDVCLARAAATHWAHTETQVSIVAEEPLDGGVLKLLIEKDFECLDPREGEDQTNRFKNPKASA